MKTPFLKFLAIALVITFTSCKKEVTLSEYKYTPRGIVLKCDKLDLKLLNEALFAFENDITEAYGKEKKSIRQAYSQFVRNAVSGRVKYTEIVSPHTLAVFEALKSKTELWNLDNPKGKLNYNSPVFKCLLENIESKDLKTTLNALISTNSMSIKLFGPALNTGYSAALSDKYLAAYIALDLFYAKLFDVDTTAITTKEEKVDFNKIPEQPKTD